MAAKTTESLINSQIHQTLLVSLQCRFGQVKRVFEHVGDPTFSFVTCTERSHCFSLTQPTANFWRMTATYNHKDYELEVSSDGLTFYLLERDGKAEQFHFNAREGLVFSNADPVFRMLLPGLWEYFRTALEGTDCRNPS